MKAIDDLREWAQKFGPMGSHDPLMFADEIEKELTANYMELPKDMDGAPIHVGDEVWLPDGSKEKVVFVAHDYVVPTCSVLHWKASGCKLVKPDTLEDLLDEFQASAIETFGKIALGHIDKETMLTEYADAINACAKRIRELMEVDR